MKTKLFLLLWITILGGCATYFENEETEECIYKKHLLFDIVNPKYQLERVVRTLDVLVYNISGELVDRYNYRPEDLALNNNMVTIVSKTPMVCYVITLVNYTDLNIEGEQNLATLRFDLITDQDNSINCYIPDSYYGAGILNMDEGVPDLERIFLYKNNNRVDVILRSSTPVDIDQYHVVLTGSNGCYDYANRDISSNQVTYLPFEFPQAINYGVGYSFSVMRMWLGDDLRLTIFKRSAPGSDVFAKMCSMPVTGHLAELITAGVKPFGTNERIQLEDHFIIDLTLNAEQQSIIGLKLNGWYAVGPGVNL